MDCPCQLVAPLVVPRFAPRFLSDANALDVTLFIKVMLWVGARDEAEFEIEYKVESESECGSDIYSCICNYLSVCICLCKCIPACECTCVLPITYDRARRLSFTPVYVLMCRQHSHQALSQIHLPRIYIERNFY